MLIFLNEDLIILTHENTQQKLYSLQIQTKSNEPEKN